MTDLNYRKKSLTETFSSSSTDSSNEEEERLKMLFMSCDSNNDGRLDKKDLITMCQKLNMLDLAEEIISALGASSSGSSISFQEFLKCRAKVLSYSETGSPRKKSPEYLVHSNYYSQPMNSQYDQLGSSSDVSQIYSSVDYDSGTQEIQEEPLSLYAMLHQCYGELYCLWTAAERENTAPSLSQQLLQCANQIHLARINRLYSELKMAVKRVNSCHASRDNYQKEIARHQKERERLKYELQNQTARYEDRLTELHSVIAELQKKNERKERNTIIEEDEDAIIEEDETGNNADYEKLNLNNVADPTKDATGHVLPYLSCSTSFVESTVFGVDKSTVSDKLAMTINYTDVQADISNCNTDSNPNMQKNDRFVDKQQETAEKQLKALHHNHICLQEKLSGYENAVSSLRTQLSSVLEERECLRKQLKDLQECVDLNSMPTYCHQSSGSVSKISLDSKSTNSSTSSPARPIMGVRQQQSKQNQIKSQTSDTDWVVKIVNKYQKSLSSPMSNSPFNSHQVDDSHSILTSGFVFLQELADNVPFPALVDPCKRISLEWQRLVANSDRESADKLLLQTTLADSKSTSDQLQCSVVQLQSDCAALARSNLLADQIIELADILIQLQDTDPLSSSVDLATHSTMFHEPAYQNNSIIVGSDNHRPTSSCGDINQLRHGYREQVESAAKLFLYRLECYSSMGRQTPDSGAGVSSTLSSGGGSVDVESVMRQASSSGGDWSKADEIKLRRLLDQLIAERNRARLSVVGTHLGQSFYGQYFSSSNQSSLHRMEPSKLSSHDLDSHLAVSNQHLIENAILLQELCGLKEERASLKTRIYLLEKEVKSVQLALESKAACEKSLKVQLNQMMQQRSDFISGSDEARRLKTQIEDLMQAHEELRDRCQLQQHQNDEFVNDLKKANAALILAFEKAKKKYQNKITKLEAQLSNSCQPIANSASDETAL